MIEDEHEGKKAEKEKDDLFSAIILLSLEDYQLKLFN
jgi:hypothetical protein